VKINYKEQKWQQRVLPESSCLLRHRGLPSKALSSIPSTTNNNKKILYYINQSISDSRFQGMNKDDVNFEKKQMLAYQKYQVS
jgi:hypothetical protein